MPLLQDKQECGPQVGQNTRHFYKQHSPKGVSIAAANQCFPIKSVITHLMLRVFLKILFPRLEKQ